MGVLAASAIALSACSASAMAVGPGGGGGTLLGTFSYPQCTGNGENAVAHQGYSQYSCAPVYNQWGNTELYQLWVA